MNKKLSLHKNVDHPFSTLWWKPLFSAQRQMNKLVEEAFSKSPVASLFPKSFWSAEDATLSSMQKDIHKLFSEMFNNRQMYTPWFMGHNTKPYIDITENDKQFKVKAELPGLDPDNIDISVSDCALTITGESQESNSQKEDNYIRKECFSNAFSRVIALPEIADLDHANAKFDNSVLTIEVPKKKGVSKKVRKLNIDSKNGVSKNSKSKSEIKSAEQKMQNASPKDNFAEVI